MSVSQARYHRTPADPEDTRAKLLESAYRVFAERGYHGATVREICQFANVNVALVNYYFGDKLELYTEVLRRAVDDPERLRGMRELMAQDLEPELLFRKVIRLILQSMLRRREQGPVHMRLMLHELARPTPAIGRVVEETVKPMHDWLRGLVGELLGLPPLHDKTRLCVQSIIGQAIHYAHHSPVISRLWPELKMTPEQQDMVADHIADFSLSHLKAVRKQHQRPATVKTKVRRAKS